MVSPVVRRGRVIAFVGSIAHVSDVGGHSGDIEALDVFQEGLRLPPCKLWSSDGPNEQLFEVIAANCRVPDLVLGDLRAMIGTHRLGAMRIHELLDDYELDDLDDATAEMHRRSERVIRDRIAALPDGTYEFGLDIDGYDERVHLHAAIRISGSDVVVDYAGTSPQSPTAAINCVYNTTFASTMFPFKCALVPEVPNNEALFRPITVVVPEGSILNARFPAPVKTRAKTTNNLNQVIFGALWPVFGERAQAGSGSIWPFTLRGDEPRYGRFVVDMLPHGGRGATAELDGMIPVAFPHNSVVTPVEIMETKAPVLFLRKELRPGSGGAGRRRGGVGQTIAFRHVGCEDIVLSIIPDKIATAPPGLAGGRPGERGVVRLNGEVIERFPAIRFRPGDELELELPGGAGFGDPAERESARVLEDVRMGYVPQSPEWSVKVAGAQQAI
jgi:N-methylhydantoinase B/oxoprolinase/acetone carboxylase alpha subunit